MIWNRIKSMKCPDCNAVLIKGQDFMQCSGCSFKIRHAKFEEMVNDMYRTRRRERREEDNQADLNNL